METGAALRWDSNIVCGQHRKLMGYVGTPGWRQTNTVSHPHVAIRDSGAACLSWRHSAQARATSPPGGVAGPKAPGQTPAGDDFEHRFRPSPERHVKSIKSDANNFNTLFCFSLWIGSKVRRVWRKRSVTGWCGSPAYWASGH